MIRATKIAVVAVSAVALAVAASITWYATCHTKLGSGGDYKGYCYAVQDASGKWGCIDRAGNVIVDFVYDDQGLAVFQGGYVIGWKKGVCYLSTTDGKPLAKATHGILLLGGGLVSLWDGDACQIMSIDGTKILGTFYGGGLFEGDGLIPVKNRTGKWGFIDHDGEVRIGFQFDGAQGFSEGRAPVEVGGAYGYIDTEGSWIVKPQFPAAQQYLEGVAAVFARGRWSYIDRAGKSLFDDSFRFAGGFSEGLAAVKDDADNVGYIDKQGRYVISPRFAWALEFCEGLAAVCFHEGSGRFSAGYIDRTGKLVIGFREDPQELGPFGGGWAPVEFRNKSGLIDRKGKWVWIDGEGPVKRSAWEVAVVPLLAALWLAACAVIVWRAFLRRRRRARHGESLEC